MTTPKGRGRVMTPADDQVRGIVREELAKQIPAGVMKANDQAANAYPQRGPLMPDEWAAAVVRYVETEKWKLDQLAAAALRSAGTDDGDRDSGAEPQAVDLPVDGGLEPLGACLLVGDSPGQREQDVALGVADGVLAPVVDELGHDAPPSGGDSAAPVLAPEAGSPAKNTPASGDLPETHERTDEA